MPRLKEHKTTVLSVLREDKKNHAATEMDIDG